MTSESATIDQRAVEAFTVTAAVSAGTTLDTLIEQARAGKRLDKAHTLRGAKLIARDLAGANLSGADLRGADLSRANLTKANLVGARLEGAVLCGSTLDGAELLKANLQGADLHDCSAIGTGFGGADLEEANLFNGKLSEASFTQSNLKAADLRAADLSGARLRECCLHDADLSRSVLRGSDLTGSDATGASFQGADLRDSRLHGIRATRSTNWVGADILNVDFCGAYLIRRQIIDQNYLHEFRKQGRLTEVCYWIWWATSDCGRSFLRWGLWTAVLAFLFAVSYQYVEIDLGGRPDNWMTNIYFSFVTLTTLGYGDIVPTSAPARIVALLEVVTGYVMLGGLLGIFANKMARRAE